MGRVATADEDDEDDDDDDDDDDVSSVEVLGAMVTAAGVVATVAALN